VYLAALLSTEPGIDVVGEAVDREQVLAICTDTQTDVVLSSVGSVSGGSGLTVKVRLVGEGGLPVTYTGGQG
jgi:DNA-binding NarL/FixJ family response regulator